ncbi:MAG: 1-acyl-sn-glycerol-3-phosphate acyltransferase [Lachnospiraceae bacterium]|nr:1-acyl-sn-glycerol-3-phosphate acyltransferase [Lachnospiraceae bacterium]
MREQALLYRIIQGAVKLSYKKFKVEGVENLPDEPAIIVGNHSKTYGPVVGQIYKPRHAYTWCIGNMMHIKEVPAYAFEDFWSKKPGYIRWFFKILSYIIAPLAAFLMTNARTIGVYKDKRVIKTFLESCDRMTGEGADIIIFPEHYDEHNNIVHDFQQGFVELARVYYKKTGRDVPFVPMYICPALGKVVLGKPIYYDHENDHKEEVVRICNALMDGISELAYALPPHRVVPYPNIKKKYYPTNERPKKDSYEE